MVRKLELNEDLPGTSVQASEEAHRTCPVHWGSTGECPPCLTLPVARSAVYCAVSKRVALIWVPAQNDPLGCCAQTLEHRAPVPALALRREHSGLICC